MFMMLVAILMFIISIAVLGIVVYHTLTDPWFMPSMTKIGIFILIWVVSGWYIFDYRLGFGL